MFMCHICKKELPDYEEELEGQITLSYDAHRNIYATFHPIFRTCRDCWEQVITFTPHSTGENNNN